MRNKKKKQAKIPEKLQFYPDEVFKEISLGDNWGHIKV